jgi:hypothetical protein
MRIPYLLFVTSLMAEEKEQTISDHRMSNKANIMQIQQPTK